MVKIIILFYLILSSIVANEPEGFRFITNLYENKDKFSYSMDVLTDFEVGGYSFQGTFSGLINTHIIDKNLPGGRVKFIQEWSNVMGFNKRNDEVKQNPDATKLNGAQFICIVDSTGLTESIEGNNNIANEMIEESESFSAIFGSDNFYYPFGSDSLRQVGDTWSYSNEKELSSQVGSDGYSGVQRTVSTITFKKIKPKRGQQIAVLKIKLIVSEEGTQLNWDESYDVKVEGEFVGTAKFNITGGYLKQYKVSGSLRGIRTKLSNDRSFNYVQNFDVKMKLK